MIVLDTNQLERQSIHSHFIALLKILAKSTNNTLALPEVAYNEHCAHYEHRLRRAYSQESKARNELHDLLRAASDDGAFHYFSETELDEPLEKTLSTYRAKLLGIFTLIKLDGPSAIEALRREAWRVAPASTSFDSKGSGARDAAIWLSLLNESVRLNETIYLVSADKAAFRAEQCRIDAESAGASIVVLNDIGELLDTLSDRIEAEVDLSKIKESALAQERILRYIRDSRMLWDITRLAVETPPSASSWLYGDPMHIELLSINDVHGHAVSGNNWVTGRIRWLIRYPVRVDDIRSSTEETGVKASVVSRRMWTVSFQIVTSLLFHGSDIMESVEVLSIARPSRISGELDSLEQFD
jgi:hypothetical protein